MKTIKIKGSIKAPKEMSKKEFDAITKKKTTGGKTNGTRRK